jgi:hypothetical protein
MAYTILFVGKYEDFDERYYARLAFDSPPPIPRVGETATIILEGAKRDVWDVWKVHHCYPQTYSGVEKDPVDAIVYLTGTDPILPRI